VVFGPLLGFRLSGTRAANEDGMHGRREDWECRQNASKARKGHSADSNCIEQGYFFLVWGIN